MEIIAAIVLFFVLTILIIVVRKNKVDSKTLQDWANLVTVSSVISAVSLGLIIGIWYVANPAKFAVSQPIATLTIEQPTLTSVTEAVVSTADSGNTTILLTPVSNTMVPSETTAPTKTVAPTETSTLVAVLATQPDPLPLPFTDNFDNGLRSEWQVLNGTPVISNGVLKSADGDLTIQTRLINTENYSINFDFYCNFSLSVVFAETVKVRFLWSFWRLQIFDNNDWKTIEDVDGPSTCKMNELQKVQINVNGNTFEFVFKGEKIYEGIFGTPSLGPITLTLDEYQRVDNLSISGN
jgi:hypothetical protein